MVGGDRPVGRQARAADVPAGTRSLRGRRDGRDRRCPARSLRPLGGRCAELDPPPERCRRAARLGRGQLRRLDADGALRDRDPDPDRRARAGADQGGLGQWPSGRRSSAASTSRPDRRPATRATRRVALSATSRLPSVVAEAFRRRAAGASWAELARFLEEQRGLPTDGQQALVEVRRLRADQEPGLPRPGPQRQGRERRSARADRDAEPSSTPPNR